MSRAERVRLEAIVRPILARYALRVLESEHLRASAQSMTRLVAEVLERGCMVQASPREGQCLSRMQQWLVAMEWVWRDVDAEFGPFARHVVILRLTRPQKTELSSFDRIATDLTAICRQLGRTKDLLMPEAEAIYRAVLPRLVRLLQDRGIGCDLPPIEVTPSDRTTYRPWTEQRSQHQLIAIGQHLRRFAQRRVRRGRRDPNRLPDVSHGARI